MNVKVLGFLSFRKMSTFDNLIIAVLASKHMPNVQLSHDFIDFVNKAMVRPAGTVSNANTVQDVKKAADQLPADMKSILVQDLGNIRSMDVTIYKNSFYSYLIAELIEGTVGIAKDDALQQGTGRLILDSYGAIAAIREDTDLLEVFGYAIPSFPYEYPVNITADVINISRGTFVLPGYIHGLEDYLRNIHREHSGSPNTMLQLARKYGQVKDNRRPYQEFDRVFSQYITRLTLGTVKSSGRTSMGFLDLNQSLQNLD